MNAAVTSRFDSLTVVDSEVSLFQKQKINEKKSNRYLLCRSSEMIGKRTIAILCTALRFVSAACPNTELTGDKGILYYKGNSSKEHCPWHLPEHPSNTHALVLEINDASFTEDQHGGCDTYLLVQGYKALCEIEHSCLIYTTTSSTCDIREIHKNASQLGQCRKWNGYLGDKLPAEIRVPLREAADPKISINLSYTYIECRKPPATTTTLQAAGTGGADKRYSGSILFMTMIAIVSALGVLLIASMAWNIWTCKRSRSIEARASEPEAPRDNGPDVSQRPHINIVQENPRVIQQPQAIRPAYENNAMYDVVTDDPPFQHYEIYEVNDLAYNYEEVRPTY